MTSTSSEYYEISSLRDKRAFRDDWYRLKEMDKCFWYRIIVTIMLSSGLLSAAGEGRTAVFSACPGVKCRSQYMAYLSFAHTFWTRKGNNTRPILLVSSITLAQRLFCSWNFE